MDETNKYPIWDTLADVVSRVAVVETKVSVHEVQIPELRSTISDIGKAVTSLVSFVEDYQKEKLENRQRAASVQGGLTYLMSVLTGIVASWGFTEFSQGLSIGKTAQVVIAVVIFFIFSSIIGLWKWLAS